MAKRPAICIDGGRCFLQTERSIPACTGACSVVASRNDRSTWRHVERLAAEGDLPIYPKIIALAKRAA